MIIGLIGCGKMGSSLAQGAIKAEVFSKNELIAYDPIPAAVETLDKALSGNSLTLLPSLDEVILKADTLLLCVKPGDVSGILSQVAQFQKGADKLLIISVAAGVTIAQMEEAAKGHARIIRAMPNTPALIGEGAAAFSRGTEATYSDASFAEKLLGSVGKVSEVKEELLDAVTGLSGSGPAYVYTFIEALADGALLEGLPREQALTLATQTVLGAAKMVSETGEHPSILRDRVTSPGGTTIAGLAALEEGSFRSTAIKAVQAATARARELGT